MGTLREEMAQELHYHDWDCEVSMAYNYGTSGIWDEQDDVLKEYYLKQADQILSLILKHLEEKLTVIGDATLLLHCIDVEIVSIGGEDGILDALKLVTKKQLQHSLSQIRGILG